MGIQQKSCHPKDDQYSANMLHVHSFPQKRFRTITRMGLREREREREREAQRDRDALGKVRSLRETAKGHIAP